MMSLKSALSVLEWQNSSQNIHHGIVMPVKHGVKRIMPFSIEIIPLIQSMDYRGILDKVKRTGRFGALWQNKHYTLELI